MFLIFFTTDFPIEKFDTVLKRMFANLTLGKKLRSPPTWKIDSAAERFAKKQCSPGKKKNEKDIGLLTYHEKRDNNSTDYSYTEEKIHYTESRDSTWTPRNKRPEKIKDTLKEVEELLVSSRCVSATWLTRKILQIFLSSGCIITFVVSLHTGDIDRIVIDKSLVGKLTGENPSHVVTTESFLLIAYTDKPRVDYVYFSKKPAPTQGVVKVEKLNTYEPKIVPLDLPGPIGRRLHRKFAINIHHDLILVWWPTASEEAWPWTPMMGERERANMVLLSCNGPKIDMVTYMRSECDPLDISFSSTSAHQIYSVEQATTSGGEVRTDICLYEIMRRQIQRFAVTTIPLKSKVVCQGRSPNEEKVLLGCEDGSLALYDEYKKTTHITSAKLTPHVIKWHPSGVTVLVASKKGEIQVFDMALAPLQIQLVSEDEAPSPVLKLNSYFRSAPTLELLQWSPVVEQQEYIPECTDSIFLTFERGPIGVLRYHHGVFTQGQLTPILLVNEYLKHRQIDQAINMLSALNWNLDGTTCYACLSTIVNNVLKQPLTPDREAQLEAALGTFYAPVKPLSEVTVLEYRDPISRLARRFFHHLLRFTRFDKAFLLAVDIGARDLFMDIHHVAQDKGETALAEVARRKAEQIDAESLATESLDSYDEDDILEEEEPSLEAPVTYHNYGVANGTAPPPRPPRQPVGSMGRKPAPPPPLPARTQQQEQQQGHRYVTPADPRFLPQRQPYPHPQSIPQNYMSLPEAALQNLEEELSFEMFNEYTAALLDEIPPPQLPSEGDEDEVEGDRTSQSVKVIHFGLV